jgi:Icc protein
MPDDILVFAHIGDLHLTTEDQDNYRDLKAIVSELAALRGAIDFVYLPGDNADNGLPEQYTLAARELARLPMPVHIVTGDHDMEPGTLDNFYHSLDAAPLPKAVDVGEIRCLFLDICGPGSGGPDFRIGSSQSAWLADEIEQATTAGRRCAVFMHSYPADLRGDGEADAINTAFEAREVLLVDMGHTHYNELANDGRTIFAATRSTGQIEEGPVGYSIATIDGRVVSWRFKELGATLPVVLITAPADRRLATDPDDRDHVPHHACQVRVQVLHGRPITRCNCALDDGPGLKMSPIADGRYELTVELPDGARTICVTAENDRGATGSETIEIATSTHLAVDRHANGSDADAIGAWPERGIPGTQLGPNRNGRKW